MDNTLIYCALHQSGCTSRDFEMITNNHLDLERVFSSLQKSSFEFTPWMTHEHRERIQKRIQHVSLKTIEDTIKKHAIKLVLYSDLEYPQNLRNISRPPFLLYIRGTLRNDIALLSIVGSRKATIYGQKIIERIVPSIIQQNIGIVSGGAFGIDSIAHKVAIENNGYTISVFGNSIEFDYPSQNAHLFEKILAAGGGLISIFPLGTRAEPYLFPQRNEIVAGLSMGVIIPEAGEKSGTLITASLALDQGKDVFSFPGDIFRSNSYGTNHLIAKGEAKCVTDANEILEEYTNSLSSSLTIEPEFESNEEKTIYKYIRSGYDTMDQLTKITGYSIEVVTSTVCLLELGSHIILDQTGKYHLF